MTRQALAGLGTTKLTLTAVATRGRAGPSTPMKRFGSKRGLLLAWAARSPLATLRGFALSAVAHIKHPEQPGLVLSPHRGA